MQMFWLDSLSGRDLSVGGRIILKLLLVTQGADWINLA